MVYSLANYKLNIQPTDSSLASFFGGPEGTLVVGGNGSYLESITISFNANLYGMTAYSTGGYIAEKNLDRSGTISLSLNQLSDSVKRFIQLINLYIDNDFGGLSMTLSGENGTIAEMKDCFLTKIPDQSFTNSSSTQTWSFVSGKITIR